MVRVGAGAYHSLAVLRDGVVVAWGDNSQGQCDTPADLGDVVVVAGGVAHSLALRSDGRVVAWGADWSGQSTVPTSLAGGAGDALAVAAGAYHSLALLSGSLPVPRLLSPAKQPAGFSTLVQSLNRKSYALEYNSSLAPTNWTAVVTNAGNGALVVLPDRSALGGERSR